MHLISFTKLFPFKFHNLSEKAAANTTSSTPSPKPQRTPRIPQPHLPQDTSGMTRSPSFVSKVLGLIKRSTSQYSISNKHSEGPLKFHSGNVSRTNLAVTDTRRKSVGVATRNDYFSLNPEEEPLYNYRHSYAPGNTSVYECRDSHRGRKTRSNSKRNSETLEFSSKRSSPAFEVPQFQLSHPLSHLPTPDSTLFSHLEPTMENKTSLSITDSRFTGTTRSGWNDAVSGYGCLDDVFIVIDTTPGFH
ncbi:hypothetical protein BABINDRAFT_85471 [Babjeviella inositovora NRRL Y-12698]|uniref:Uncharacterized protein n=1 Tax=Babjeviella inositovora NRRL Y-12698 TaxID=984486 RepID=A0A1E3QLE4_9ASCO|nr:uncharacterized protein BABINDRAFT_85471 [Babjeviella inositovora NRRL Y-12698]ODQ78505.1 hypothetical protein BABINDRAFT_85471 [Babjeviella inositovora NRRL Y-12698]